MIQAGNSVTAAGELMKKLPVEYLHKSLCCPRPEIESQVRQLRVVRQIDSKQYAQLKRRLPYFVCGIFNPANRKTENFNYIEYFVLDIDKLSDKGYSTADIRRRVQEDSRVRLCFVSPGEDGLKVMFKLSERCHDARIYSLFYKSFVEHFSKLYNLEQVIDKCTSDVSRACFISVDSEAYFNAGSETVSMKAFVNLDNPIEMFAAHKQEKLETREETTTQKQEPDHEPDNDTLARIKQILNPKLKLMAERPPVYVPQQLNEIIADLEAHVRDAGVEVTEILNIQYGKKLRFKLGLKLAEVNLFHGKRGFSVVVSPRTGTNAELNDTMARLVECYIFEKQSEQ